MDVGAAWKLPAGVVVLRPWRDDDDVDALTDLLHCAYARHRDAGLHFVATHQDADTTERRLAKGIALVGELDGRMVATVTLTLHEHDGTRDPGCAWYRRAEVARFNQFAVSPDLQGQGLGARILDFLADVAARMGAAELACDTSEHAEELIAWYMRRGFRHVDNADWRPHANYRSVVLSRTL